MPSSMKWRVPVVLAAIGLSAWFAFPLSQRINLGLDLQGGMHLILRVDASAVKEDVRDRDVTGVALEIIRNRVDQ
ncbi:MAG TPA: protein translocase subunit SecD, partial [Candidatus Omnitrophica bacterium]|nr:protein translocase subunit SecD [Candidatus Omnitrophota bacterium]